MSFKVVPTVRFIKELKKLFKKYPSVKEDVAKIESLLMQNPKAGISLGNNVFKLRINIQSKSSGKRGGARLITYVVDRPGKIYYYQYLLSLKKKQFLTRRLKK